MDGDIFQNVSRVEANVFYMDKQKMPFQTYPDACGRGIRRVILESI